MKNPLPKKRLLATALLFFFTCYLVYSLYQSGFEQGFYWVYIYPVVAIALLGINRGKVWVAFFLAIVINLVLFDSYATNKLSLQLLIASQLVVSIFIIVFLSTIYQEYQKKEKAIDKAKDQFFSIASHELRTPLVLMRGNASQLGDMYNDKLDDQGRMIIKDIHDSSERLLHIVNEFLNTSRLEEGRMQFRQQPFPLLPLIEQCVQELAKVGGQKGVEVKLLQPKQQIPDVLADQDRVKEVVMNLIDNALKFTEKGAVTVEVHYDNGIVKTSVTDTGNGVPETNKTMLFSKFQQASNNKLAHDTTKSSGLGLYIARLMVEGMGGKIYLEQSVENKGSTFSFELPTGK